MGPLVDPLVDPLAAQTGGPLVDRWAQWVSRLQQVQIQPLLGVVLWSLCRQRRRPTGYPVGIVLRRHELFQLKFLVSPWWHPIYPHGAA